MPAVSESTESPVLTLQSLDWDTEFFGHKMGVILPNGINASASSPTDAAVFEQQLTELISDAKNENYSHLILRVPTSALAAVWAAEKAGMRLVDVGLDSSCVINAGTAALQTSMHPIRSATSGDSEQIRSIAASSFILSRFSADPFFTPDQVAAFHRQWVTNLCNGLAKVVLICEIDGRIAGFVSCAVDGDAGRIPLIAAHPGIRRKGVGWSLVSAALDWFKRAGVGVVRVKTQAHNYPALALYQRAGFTVSSAELTFSVAPSAQR